MAFNQLSEHNASFYFYSLAQPGRKRSVRLLEIEPGDWDDPIRCELTRRSLTHDYWALSYVWGSFTGHRSIQVNGKPDFWVTESAFAALRRLRWLDRERNLGGIVIWIDAICINQADLQERNAQVSMMAAIYSRAKAVVIWLGSCVTLQPGQSEAIECTDETHDDNILMFMDNNIEWWRRCWTYQEFLMSDQAYFLKGPHLFEFWRYLSDRSLPQSKSVLRLACLPEHVDLFTLLAQTRHRRATDPRDKVYSVLSPCRSKDGRLAVEVDYSKPLGQVAYETSNALVNEGYSISHLHRMFGFAYSHSTVSWVPGLVTPCKLPAQVRELTLAYEGDLLGTLRAIGHRWCSKDGPSGKEREMSRVINATLFADGLAFEAIAQVFMRPQDGGESGELESHLANVFTEQSQRALGPDEAIKPNRTLLDRINRRASRKPKAASMTDQREIAAMIGAGAALFFTDGDHIGIATPGVVIGDLIAVLFGFPRLLVMRSVTIKPADGTDGDTFRLVSEALVPSLESGQLVDLYRKGRVQKRTFMIV